MTQKEKDKLTNAAIAQGVCAAAGAAYGVATKHALVPKPGMRPPMASQIASAMGAAAASGGGVGGAVAAGTAVVAAKAAAAAAVATAAAPFVIGAVALGGTVWGVCKLIDYLDE